MKKMILCRLASIDRHTVEVVDDSRQSAEDAITDEGGKVRNVDFREDGFHVVGTISPGNAVESDRLEGNGWKWEATIAKDLSKVLKDDR